MKNWPEHIQLKDIYYISAFISPNLISVDWENLICFLRSFTPQEKVKLLN